MPLVKLFANLRQVAGVKEVPVAGTSVGEVMVELVQQIPALEAALIKDGQIRPHVVITINGHPNTDMQAVVMDDDVIAVFPPIAGGSPHPLKGDL